MLQEKSVSEKVCAPLQQKVPSWGTFRTILHVIEIAYIQT